MHLEAIDEITATAVVATDENGDQIDNKTLILTAEDANIVAGQPVRGQASKPAPPLQASTAPPLSCPRTRLPSSPCPGAC